MSRSQCIWLALISTTTLLLSLPLEIRGSKAGGDNSTSHSTTNTTNATQSHQGPFVDSEKCPGAKCYEPQGEKKTQCTATPEDKLPPHIPSLAKGNGCCPIYICKDGTWISQSLGGPPPPGGVGPVPMMPSPHLPGYPPMTMPMPPPMFPMGNPGIGMPIMPPFGHNNNGHMPSMNMPPNHHSAASTNNSFSYSYSYSNNNGGGGGGAMG